MTERFNPKQQGIDMRSMPNLTETTSLGEVIAQFKDRLKGQLLITHLLQGGQEDIVTAFKIEDVTVEDDGTFDILSTDTLDQPVVHHFNGNNTTFTWSVYEANDFWFQDLIVEGLWYGIYSEPIMPAYLHLDEEK